MRSTGTESWLAHVVGRPLWLLLVAVGVFASACAGGEPPRPAAPIVRAAEQQLRVAVGEDEFLQGNPPAPNLGLLSDGLNPGIFETLTVITPSFGLRPGLASRWRAESPTEWRFELRPGVRFHDGSPLTAAAVVESLRRVTGGTNTPPRGEVALRGTRPRGLDPDSATAVEDLVVRIVLSEPNLRLAEQLAGPRTAISAPGTVAGDGMTRETTPTGTGPFRFSSYRPGVDLEVKAFPEYRDGPPELQGITFRFGPEKDASLLLATGKVDAVGYVAADVLANVQDGEDRRVLSPAARASFLLLNRGGVAEWSTLQEDPVRSAVAQAVDRAAIAAKAWPEHGKPSDSLIPPLVLGASADSVRPPRLDPAAAGKLLDDAGWRAGADGMRARDGRPLVLDVLVRQPVEGMQTAAAALRDQLRSVGIATSTVEGLPGNPTPLQRVNAASFDLFLDLRGQDDANPCALCRFFSIRPGADLTVAGVVGAGPDADTLFDQVHAAPSIESARRAAADLMQVALAKEVVALPLATLSNVWLLSPQVEGFEPAALGGAQQWQRVFRSR